MHRNRSSFFDITVISLLAGAILITAGTAVLPHPAAPKSARAENTVSVNTQPSAISERSDVGSYIIRNIDGHVLIFRTGSENPIGEVAISYYDLPAEDRAMLDCGLIVDDEQSLWALIEDYSE